MAQFEQRSLETSAAPHVHNRTPSAAKTVSGASGTKPGANGTAAIRTMLPHARTSGPAF